MKKYLLSFAVLAMGMSLLTACSDDDDDKPVVDPVVTPTTDTIDVSTGMFIVGSGNKKAGIDGNISYIDYTHGWSVEDIFQQANKKSIGKTGNYISAYGSKLYIVVDGEATIWVCDKQTLKVEKQISTTQLLGEKDGLSPRAAIGYDGKIYLTCYGKSYDGENGIVAAIDTVNFAKQQTYTVGSYPNGLALLGDNIFVTNSDYGNGMKPSLSKIDLKSGNVSEIKDAAITNPMEILTAGDAVYFLDYGTYEAGTWKQVGAGVRKVTLDGKVTKVVDGTAMGSDGKKIYTANAPYLGDGINYFIYDIATGTSKTWEPADIFSPAMIVADPVTGNVFIVSYQNNGGWAAYDLPTYTNQYDAAGNFVKKYENTATGAISAVFNTHTEYVTK